MSDRLEELTSDWRPYHHEGWAQRWLTHMLGQVDCGDDHVYMTLGIYRSGTVSFCEKCGAAR